MSNNFANRGGGIDSDGTLTLNNSTVSNNVAPISAGGINIYFNYPLYLNNSTVTNNTGRGINASGLTIMSNSIVANSISGADCNGVNSFNVSYSLVGDGTCGVMSGVNGNLTGDPLLGELADNGGPTFTHALLPGSPALDAGDPVYAGPLTTDQRGTGFARVFNNRIDIGAFELQPPPACPLSQGDWKNNPVWPVNGLTLGDETYANGELLDILNTPVGRGRNAARALSSPTSSSPPSSTSPTASTEHPFSARSLQPTPSWAASPADCLTGFHPRRRTENS